MYWRTPDAQKKAKSGEVVLLSPAATSFDMFNSYAERGDTFIKIAESLP
jgi:UDP-N-acetylmuramoylalanine--D-glutamate ligase